MSDWNKPTTTSNYSTEFIPEISNRLLDVAKGNDPAIVTVTNVPTNMIRWTSASSKWEKYNGSSWADLAATYGISISGSAGSCATWTTGRTIALTGDVTGTSGTFNGSANLSFSTTLATVTEAKGGTGQAGGYAVGDILYASGAAALSKLADVATGNVLISGGVTTAPAWGKVGLTTHVSGQLGLANGGTTGTDAASARTGISAPGRAAPPAGLDSSVIAYDNRAITNPTTGLAYMGGARFRHGSMNEDSSAPFADVIDLSTYTSSANGGFNALYMDKATQRIQHKWGAAAATSWTVKDLLYADVSNLTGTVPLNKGGTGGTDATGARNGLGASTGIWGVAVGGTGVGTLTGIVKGNGTSAFSAATVGTDYAAPGTASTWTTKQTFSTTMKVQQALEKMTVTGSTPGTVPDFDALTQAIQWYTTNPTTNWTLNVRGDGGNSLDSIMATGESLTISLWSTMGATPYYASAFKIDGSSVTPKWIGGTAPSSGDASCINVYTYSIVKTGAATFTVVASKNKTS